MHRTVKIFACAIVLVSLFKGSCLLGQDVPVDDHTVVYPSQRVTVPNLPAIKSSDLGSSSVAKTAIAIVLAASNVKCSRDSQINTIADANAGESLRTFARKLTGAFYQTSGQKLQVSANFTPNEAIQADQLIASIKQGQPLLIEWNGNLYVLHGVVYVERLHDSGRQDNAIRELLLIDPRYSDQRRFIAFDREKDNFSEVEGIASVSTIAQ